MIFDKDFFAHRLLLKQKVFDLSLRDAGKQIGISAATLSRLNRGKTPDIISFAKCCQWLNLELDKFILKK